MELTDAKVQETLETVDRQRARALAERRRQARELAIAVPQILEGAPVPHQVLQGFALMVEGLLAEEES